jgi:hypothetical protein
VAEQVDRTQPERLADPLDLVGVALNGPERPIVRSLGGAAAELIEGHDAPPALRQPRVRLAQIVAGQPGSAVE